MSSTGLKVFDSTLQQTHEWLNSVSAELSTDDRESAYSALRAALHALRDRIPVKAATEFGAQLPMLVRGFYYEGFNPAHTPEPERHKDEFLASIADVYAKNNGLEPLKIANAAFKTVNKFMTEGQIMQTRNMLNEEYRDEVWPKP